MIELNHIKERIQSLFFPESVVTRYMEPHRYYHNAGHLQQVLESLGKEIKDDELFLAAVYHDAVYDPKKNDNEEKSAALFLSDASSTSLSSTQKENIRRYILDTKTHTASDSKSQILIDADLNILNQSFEKLIAFEHQIFREFQFVDYKTYQEKRLEVLQGLNKTGNLTSLIEYVNYRKPLIGVFCGSFNPFHKGHYNVLQKAEKIFDKVIIAFGKNPEKDGRNWPVPKALQYHQLEEYNGLLTDFIATLSQDVTVIRGLRNSTDFQYEQNQYRYIQELMPGIKIINIFCDKEFEHISSSGIRTLEKFNKHHNYILD
jgi:pantetheine-phosphate adenylyltransferase